MPDTKEKVLTMFCNLFDGREKELLCQPILYSSIALIAEELNISIHDVATVLADELNKILPDLPD